VHHQFHIFGRREKATIYEHLAAVADIENRTFARWGCEHNRRNE
jgi:hypothetical protein